MKIKLLFSISLLITFYLSAQTTYPSWRVQLVAHFKPDTYFSGCWGWYDPIKNREYGISGAHKGTYFVDITNPNSAYIADSVIGIPINTWREIKTYKNYCYIISDDYGPSFQIVDLSPLPDSVRVISSPDTGILFKGHTLWVDGHYLYVGGPKDKYGYYHSMGVFNLHPNPEKPQLVRWLDDDFPNIYYVHDMFVKHDTIFASCGNQGLHVYKLDTVQNKFIYISSLTFYLEAGYNHSSALTQNSKTLVFMDEVPSGLSFKVADVSDITNIQVVSYVKPYNFGGFIAHNPFILGNKHLVASCYQDGTLIYDISNPANPVMTGYFDTYPQGGANTGVYSSNTYDGNWGSYPFFPSGLILSNDMANGIFILRADTALSVKEISENVNTVVFPNPAKEKLQIFTSLKNHLKISIQDITGKAVFESFVFHSDINTPIEIHLPQLNDGMYVLEISSDQIKSVKKIVIQN